MDYFQNQRGPITELQVDRGLMDVGTMTTWNGIQMDGGMEYRQDTLAGQDTLFVYISVLIKAIQFPASLHEM